MVFFSQDPQKTSEPTLIFFLVFFSVVFRYCPSGIERAKSESRASQTRRGNPLCTARIFAQLSVRIKSLFWPEPSWWLRETVDGQTNYQPWVMEQIFHLKVVAAQSDQAFMCCKVHSWDGTGGEGKLVLLLPQSPAGVQLDFGTGFI